MESLRSELQEFIGSRLEEVMRPLMTEASTIKLWLARVANHLERMEPLCEDPLVGLFGPCSPVRRSPTPTFFTSLPVACTPTTQDSLPHDGTSATATDLGNQKHSDANVTDVMMATSEQEEQLRVLDPFPEFVATRDLTKLDAMTSRPSEVNEY